MNIPEKIFISTYFIRINKKIAMTIVEKIDLRIIVLSRMILNWSFVLLIRMTRKKRLLIMVATPAPKMAYS